MIFTLIFMVDIPGLLVIVAMTRKEIPPLSPEVTLRGIERRFRPISICDPGFSSRNL